MTMDALLDRDRTRWRHPAYRWWTFKAWSDPYNTGIKLGPVTFFTYEYAGTGRVRWSVCILNGSERVLHGA